MLRIIREYGLCRIEIRFYYENLKPPNVGLATIGINPNENRRCSIATITINGLHVGRGISVCHPKDNFCRAIGRKKALANALSNCPKPLSKAVRSDIWKEYKAQCKI